MKNDIKNRKEQNNPLLKCVGETATSFRFTKLRVYIYDSKLQEEKKHKLFIV